MKLRNKETGEIIDIKDALRGSDDYPNYYLISDKWEDVPEEPKEDGLDNIIALVEAYSSIDSERYPKEIVEKFKAWQRLKDKGFRFGGWTTADLGADKYYFTIIAESDEATSVYDLDLLFRDIKVLERS